MPDSVASERRLVCRVEKYWNSLREHRPFARTVDIDPVELGDDWCDCFVIGSLDVPEEAHFLFVGPSLLESARLPEDWPRTSERRLADCPEGSVLTRSVCRYEAVLRQGGPVTVSETFREKGEEVRLRGILLPLSSNGRDIDAALGAANCARTAALSRPAPL